MSELQDVLESPEEDGGFCETVMETLPQGGVRFYTL